jgi:hypothetical protein
MNVTNNDHKDVMRGKEAQMVLENEAFKLAMQSIKTSVMEQWKACPIRDREGAALLLQLAKVTDKFESLLVGMVQSGNFAQRKIDMDKERDEPAIRRFARKVVNG